MVLLAKEMLTEFCQYLQQGHYRFVHLPMEAILLLREVDLFLQLLVYLLLELCLKLFSRVEAVVGRTEDAARGHKLVGAKVQLRLRVSTQGQRDTTGHGGRRSVSK